MDEESLEARAAAGDLAAIAETWYRSGEAKRFETPPEVLAWSQSDEFRAKVEMLQLGFRNRVAEVQEPTFERFDTLFVEFVKSLILVAARQHPPSSVSDDPKVFQRLWLPRWVREEALKEWTSSVPPGFEQKYSNRKEFRTFRKRINSLVKQTLWQEGLRASTRRVADASPVPADLQASASQSLAVSGKQPEGKRTMPRPVPESDGAEPTRTEAEAVPPKGIECGGDVSSRKAEVTSAPKAQSLARSHSEAAEKLRKEVREMKAAGLKQLEMCERLDANKRLTPEGARWDGLCWRKAYLSPKYKGRVKKWLSKAGRGVTARRPGVTA